MAQYRGDDATFHQFPYDTTGLRAKRLRLLSDIPVNDAGVPQDLPKGITDVIAIDDQPNINLTLRVHPPDDPNCVAFVGFEQLALYDELAADDQTGEILADENRRWRPGKRTRARGLRR